MNTVNTNANTKHKQTQTQQHIQTRRQKRTNAKLIQMETTKT